MRPEFGEITTVDPTVWVSDVVGANVRICCANCEACRTVEIDVRCQSGPSRSTFAGWVRERTCPMCGLNRMRYAGIRSASTGTPIVYRETPLLELFSATRWLRRKLMR